MLAKNNLDFVDRVMLVLIITMQKIDVGIQKNSNTVQHRVPLSKKSEKIGKIHRRWCWSTSHFRSIIYIQCDKGDNCPMCHTRTEQQFHPDIYKSTKCHDMQQTTYCPRGPFCAFAHVEQQEHEQNEDPMRSRTVSDARFELARCCLPISLYLIIIALENDVDSNWSNDR